MTGERRDFHELARSRTKVFGIREISAELSRHGEAI